MRAHAVSIIQDWMLLLDQASWSRMSTFTLRHTLKVCFWDGWDVTWDVWRTEDIRNSQADCVCVRLHRCKDLNIRHMFYPGFHLVFSGLRQFRLVDGQASSSQALQNAGCLFYLVLGDDPVGLCWFSPLQDDLLLISAALKGLQRNRTRHCGKQPHLSKTDHTKQNSFPNLMSRIHDTQPGTSCSVNIYFQRNARTRELFKD